MTARSRIGVAGWVRVRPGQSTRTFGVTENQATVAERTLLGPPVDAKLESGGQLEHAG